MIELQMVYRMARRGLVLVPVVVGALWIAQGPRWAWSAAAGIAMTLLNLFLAAQIIGRVADKTPRLLVPAALVSMVVGLALLTLIALLLRATDVVDFPVTGFTLIGSHLVLVLWEGAGGHGKVRPVGPAGPARVRS